MKKGFTIIEMVIALVIISIILLVVVPLGQTAMENSRIANAISSVKAIQTAAVEWENDVGGGQYSNISFAQLAPATGTQYLPAQFSATSTDPWNGDYTVSVDPNSSEMLDIAMTNVPASAATKLTNQLTKISSGAAGPQYTPANNGTWTIVLQ